MSLLLLLVGAARVEQIPGHGVGGDMQEFRSGEGGDMQAGGFVTGGDYPVFAGTGGDKPTGGT